jgi:DNA-binding transcriptional LysR family regulator
MEWSDRIGRRISLRDLHILITVVQCRSLAKAAKHLAISRPVISKAIAHLEYVLGVRLLERDRHGAEPTVYGAAVLKRGIAIFDELRKTVNDIEFLADPVGGDVRIGCHHFLATGFVSAVIDRLSRRYPRMVFHVLAGDTGTLHRELHDRNIDLLVAWRLGPFADEALGFEFLFHDSFVVAAGSQHPWAQRRRVELAKLAGESWALPPPTSALGSINREAFRASGLDYPRATVFTVPAEVLISQLASGRFLTIVPESVLRFPIKRPEIKVLPVKLPMHRVPIGIVSVINHTPSPVTALFIAAAHALAKPLIKRKG